MTFCTNIGLPDNANEEMAYTSLTSNGTDGTPAVVQEGLPSKAEVEDTVIKVYNPMSYSL
jgi:hypothetical protein